MALQSPSTEQLRSISLDCLSQNGHTVRGVLLGLANVTNEGVRAVSYSKLYLKLKTMWGSEMYFVCYYIYVCILYEVWWLLLVVMSSWAAMSVWSSLHTEWVCISLWCTVVELWVEWGFKVTFSHFKIPLIFFDTIYSGLLCFILLKILLLGLEGKKSSGQQLKI